MMSTKAAARRLVALATAGLAIVALTACGADKAAANPGPPIVGLITKTADNPFFVKMREGAKLAAEQAGVELRMFAGKDDSDHDTQVRAIEELIAAGAEGILITPADSAAIVPEVEKARAAGMIVLALDNTTDPEDAVDATYATDNVLAGISVGEWAKAKLGPAAAATAKIALLNLTAGHGTVDVQRDQGFLDGFGVDVGDPDRIGDETDPRIVGRDVTEGAEEGGRTAMRNLLGKDPGINLVFTSNEPGAAGAYEELKAIGREKDVTIVSIDGGCAGVTAVKQGRLGATAQQYPLKMAQLGVDAIAQYATDGIRPGATIAAKFVDTGVTLITDQVQTGVQSADTAIGLDNCFG